MSEYGCTRNKSTTDEDSESERPNAAETRSSSEMDDDDGVDRAHLDDVADGSGCTEIWEQLSEQRERDAD